MEALAALGMYIAGTLIGAGLMWGFVRFLFYLEDKERPWT